MSEHTIDLLSIPIYQQMTRAIYFDRCMVKWAGMLEYFVANAQRIRENCAGISLKLSSCHAGNEHPGF